MPPEMARIFEQGWRNLFWFSDFMENICRVAGTGIVEVSAQEERNAFFECL